MAGGTPMPEDPYVTHLGDGLYARYTGYSIVFMVNHHASEPVAEMDLSSLRNLVTFVQRCEHHLEKTRAESAS